MVALLFFFAGDFMYDASELLVAVEASSGADACRWCCAGTGWFVGIEPRKLVTCVIMSVSLSTFSLSLATESRALLLWDMAFNI